MCVCVCVCVCACVCVVSMYLCACVHKFSLKLSVVSSCNVVFCISKLQIFILAVVGDQARSAVKGSELSKRDKGIFLV